MRVSLLFQLFVQSFQPFSEISFRSSCYDSSSSVKNDAAVLSKGAGVYRSILSYFLLFSRITPRSTFFHSISDLHGPRERVVERSLLLFVCISFPNRVFSVRKIANSLSKYCCNRWAWHAISCVLNNIKVLFKERERERLQYFLSAALFFILLFITALMKTLHIFATRFSDEK